MIPFNQIPENSIYSYRKEKKKKRERERERCMCQEKKMGGGMNYKER